MVSQEEMKSIPASDLGVFQSFRFGQALLNNCNRERLETNIWALEEEERTVSFRRK